MPGTVIAGVNASPGAADALALARALAPVLGADVLAAEVDPARRPDRRPASAARPVTPAVTVRAPSVCAGLRTVAEREGAILVAVGASHRTGLARLSRHAGGERLLDRAPCALAFAPPGFAERPPAAVRVIGVGFDGDPEAADAARAAAGLALRLGATLRVHAFTAPVPAPFEPPAVGASAKEQLERLLNQLLDELPAQVRPFGQVSIGEPVAGLLEVAAGADLLVLGSHGRGLVDRAIFGSVAPQVVHEARTPVLAFPPGTAAPFEAALPVLA